MANVLPLSDKIHYKRMRMLRVAIVLSGMAVLVSMVGIATLIPAFMRAQGILSDAQLRVSVTESEATTETRETLNARALLLRKQVEALAASNEQDALAVLYAMLAVADTQGNAIVITRISYGIVNGANTVVVAGVARTREALDAFGRALKKDPATKTAVIPVSLLAGSEGIEFSIPITLTQNKK